MISQVNIRIEQSEKQQLDEIFANLGMTTAQALKIFAKKSIEVGGLPFEVTSPNARLQNAINSQDDKYFKNADEGLAFLND